MMNLDNIDEKAPILNDKDKAFFKFNNNKSKTKLEKLINHYVVFKYKYDPDSDYYILFTGKLLQVNKESLCIRLYDDGTNNYKNYFDNPEEFEDYIKEFNLKEILEIEEYKKSNPKLKFKDEYINKLCKITNYNDKSIKAIVVGLDDKELLLKCSYIKNKKVYITEKSCVFYFIKNINIIEN